MRSVTDTFPAYLPEYAASILFGVWAIGCLIAVWIGGATALIGALVVSGIAQNVFVAWFGQLAFTLMDDVAALLVVAVALLHALRFKSKRNTRALLVLLGIGLVVAIAALRASDFGTGLGQARQVFIPIGLVFAGFVLWDRINWRRLLIFIGVLGVGAAIWMIIEGAIEYPIVYPTDSMQLRLGDTSNRVVLRNGLPPAYYADGVVAGQPIFRPGGPFMNPPTAGFFLGLATLGVAHFRSIVMRIAGYSLIAIALLESFARAGILIAACVVIAYFSWRVLGRTVTFVSVVVAAVLLFAPVASQGRTAAHSDGLFYGFLHGATTIIGDGFGTYGWQADGAADGIGESLLGLYSAWMGIPLIAAIVWLLWRVGKAHFRTFGMSNRYVWFVVGFVAAAGLSETASALSATGVAWLLVGVVIAPEFGRVDDEDQIPRWMQKMKERRASTRKVVHV